jgi:paraquat-inducible protein B
VNALRRSTLFAAALSLATVFSPHANAQNTSVDDARIAAEDARTEVAKTERRLHIAERKTEVAHLGAEIEAVRAEAAVAEARRKLEAARGELEHFRAHTRPTKTQAAEIDRDQARYAAEHAQAELAELEAMYEAEEFAEMTKELVLRRGRRSLEIALRRLEVEGAKLRALGDEFDRNEQQLQGAIAAAEIDLHAAELTLRKERLAGRIAIEEAEADGADLRADLERTLRKLQRAEQQQASSDVEPPRSDDRARPVRMESVEKPTSRDGKEP